MNDDDRFLILSDAPTLLKCNVNIQRFLAKPLDFLAAQATPVDERGFHSARGPSLPLLGLPRTLLLVDKVCS